MDWKIIVLLIVLALCLIGLVVAIANVIRLLSDNNDLSGELERYKKLYGEVGKTVSAATERIGILESQLQAVTGTVGDIETTTGSIIDNQRRIEEFASGTWREAQGLGGLIRHIDEGLQANNN